MAITVFVNYRRDDAGAEAILVEAALRQQLGDDCVFMDTHSLEGGDEWPKLLRTSLNKASVIIAVIGPEWLRISDEWGRRRIDQENDWVRQELAYTLADPQKRVIPVLVRGGRLPPAEVLPSDIRALPNRQAIELRPDYWSHDVQLLLAQLQPREHDGTLEGQQESPYPVNPPEGPDALAPDRVLRILENELIRWSLIESPLPENPASTRIELFREFRFQSFEDAIRFMSQVAPGCDIAMHHPRWENIWQTLRVYLTTWDIGHRISDRDVQLARYFDRAYSEFYPGTRPDSRDTSSIYGGGPAD